MKTMPEETHFAKMAYLEKMRRRYPYGVPNKRTQAFFESLMQIEKAQKEGKGLEEAYLALAKSAGFSSIEYGYYHANIHYYLFEDCAEFENSDAYKDSVNRRIGFYLDSADPLELFQRGWFPLNFPIRYRSFLEIFYGKQIEEPSCGAIGAFLDLSSLIRRCGNKEEKGIAESLRPIIEEYEDWKKAI